MKEKRYHSKNSQSSIKKINFMNSTKMIDWIDNDIYLYLYIKDFIIKLKNFLMIFKKKIIFIKNIFFNFKKIILFVFKI